VTLIAGYAPTLGQVLRPDWFSSGGWRARRRRRTGRARRSRCTGASEGNPRRQAEAPTAALVGARRPVNFLDSSLYTAVEVLAPQDPPPDGAA